MYNYIYIYIYTNLVSGNSMLAVIKHGATVFPTLISLVLPISRSRVDEDNVVMLNYCFFCSVQSHLDSCVQHGVTEQQLQINGILLKPNDS